MAKAVPIQNSPWEDRRHPTGAKAPQAGCSQMYGLKPEPSGMNPVPSRLMPNHEGER